MHTYSAQQQIIIIIVEANRQMDSSFSFESDFVAATNILSFCIDDYPLVFLIPLPSIAIRMIFTHFHRLTGTIFRYNQYKPFDFYHGYQAIYGFCTVCALTK